MTDALVQNIANLAKVKKADVFQHLQIIQDHKKNRTKFTDPEFPPQETSLIQRMETPAKWRTYVWRRASEFLPADKIKVFDNIDPNDILQGQLGDCYFLSCLSALAERPKLVERLFLTEEPNEAGCYSIWLNDNGEWRNFIIDDYFPCAGPRQGPCFTRANGTELWVLLLEKAYAKMHGSYDIIEGGDPAWALRDLTGAPWDFLDSTDPNEVWKFIMNSEAKQYLSTCYTRNTNIREEQNPLGIVFGHAYSILDAKEVITEGGTVRLIRIRNPWGKFEWKGDWGDESDKWTENTKSQVNYENRDDGTFWMNVTDFVKYYEGVGICKLHENYQYKSISFDHKGSGKSHSMFRVLLREKTHIFLSVNQKDDRSFPPNAQYQYSTIRFMLGRIDEEGLTYIDGKFFNDRNVVIEQTLEAGHYIIVIEFYWRQGIYQQANVSAYSEKKIEFEEIARADINLIQRNLLKSYALVSQTKSKNYASLGGRNISKTSGSHLGMIFFYYNNQETTKKITETVNATRVANLQIQAPFTNDQSFTVQVLPKDDYLVFYKIVDETDAFAFAPSAVTEIKEASPNDLQSNRGHAYGTTTYVDDPNDKTEQSRDVSYYDDYIKSNIDLPLEDPTNLVSIVKREPARPAQPVQPAVINPISPQRPEPQREQAIVPLPITIDQVEPYRQQEVIVAPGETYPQRTATVFDGRLWRNFPKYVSDDSRLGSWAIKDFEKSYGTAVDEFFNTPVIDTVFLALLGVMTLCVLCASLLRPQFLDIALIISLLVLLISRTSSAKIVQENNVPLRVYPYLFMASWVLDIVWMIAFAGNTTHDDPLGGVKSFVVVMSVINLLTKVGFTMILWWKVINALKNKN